MEISNVYAFRAHNYTSTEAFTASTDGLYLAIAFTVNSEASSKTLIADIGGPGTPVATFSKSSAYNQDDLNKRQIQYRAALYNLAAGQQLIFTAQGSTGTHNNTAFYVFKLSGINGPELTIEYFQTGIDNTQIGTTHNFNLDLPAGVFFSMFSSCKDSGTCAATISVTGADSAQAVPVTFSAAGPLDSAVSVFELASSGAVNVASTNDGGGSYATKQYQIFRIGTAAPPPPVWGFNLELQRNNSEPIKLDKDTTPLGTLAGVLRDNCSIENPVFMVQAGIAELAGVNYVTVPEFGRSYFVTDTVSISNDFTEISCRVDVLSSFKAGIRQNKGIVHRQENRWNLYLNDGSLKAYQNPLVDTIVFPEGFSGQSYVLIMSGFHGGGNNVGSPSDISIYDQDPTGAGNVYSKTTGGLLAYARAQIGKPYWFGTFGNSANQSLLDAKRYQYPDQYPASGTFADDFGERVHDCVGLVKGYRWSETPSSTPVYAASEDVDCTGLFYQCNTRKGSIAGTSTGIPLGAVLFVGNWMPDGTYRATHCGIFSGTGKVIEARGRAYGVVESNLSDRYFTEWGVPAWLQISTARQAIS